MAAAVRMAGRELSAWRQRASCIPDPEIRRQALGSIDHKAFHSAGASTFAAAVSISRLQPMVRFTVAYQTLSDYLDNLSDRYRPTSASWRRRVHQAMVHALRPHAQDVSLGDFGDGGYARGLVSACQESLARMRVRDDVLRDARRLAWHYAGMQTRKHAAAGTRRALMRRWAGRLGSGLPWWEWGAAAGSTLGIFALVALGNRRGNQPAPRATVEAYFPWIGAYHILLDYAIDRAEDARVQELNFAACYPTEAALCARLLGVAARSRMLAAGLWDPIFHRMIVAGLGAVYLTDPKAKRLAGLLAQLQRQDPWMSAMLPGVLRWRASQRTRPQVAPWRAGATEGIGRAAGECPGLNAGPSSPSEGGGL